MARTITVIPGDGIGPEICRAMMDVLDSLSLGLRFEVVDAGLECFERTGELVPAAVHKSLRRNRVAIKGPTTTPVGKGHKSVNVALRQEYELFANIRPIQLIPGIRSRYIDLGESMNMVIFRENTEDLYAGIEHTIVPGVVETLKIITEKASRRIARLAFEYARLRGRRKVTVGHKANIMKLSDGLFLECARREARRFPEIAFEEVIVDNLCLQIVVRPSHFDVILLPNLYGDIISDLCAGLVGGLGVTPGANIGRNTAIFESVHGTAPDIAGQGKANPTAIILSAAMMLRHLHLDDAAFRLRGAVREVISRGEAVTADLGGRASTGEYAAALIEALRRSAGAPARRRTKARGKKAPRAAGARRKTPAKGARARRA